MKKYYAEVIYTEKELQILRLCCFQTLEELGDTEKVNKWIDQQESFIAEKLRTWKAEWLENKKEIYENE